MSATITSRNGFDPEITDPERVYFISGKLCSSKRDGSESESNQLNSEAVTIWCSFFWLFFFLFFFFFWLRFLLLVEYQH